MTLPARPADATACLARVTAILDSARGAAVRAVNVSHVSACWEIGREIVEEEQVGAERANYGAALIRQLASQLTQTHGKGYSISNLKQMRQFYLACRDRVPAWRSQLAASGQIGQTPSGLLAPDSASALPVELSWSHWCVLLRVSRPEARRFYEVECVRSRWSVRELDRQVSSLLYERLAASRDKDGLLALTREGQQVQTPADFVKDPYVLEFVGLPDAARWRESDLEAALVERLQHFLLELGKDLFFVARQRRITVDGDHFWVDLVFYHRALRCFLLIDLKVGRLTQQDIGQMLLYTGYFEREETRPDENPPIGLILCTTKNDAVVRYTLGERAQQIFASRYLLHLPTEEELAAELSRERVVLEHVRLADGDLEPEGS